MRGYAPTRLVAAPNTMAEAESEWLTPTNNLVKAIYSERDNVRDYMKHTLF